MIRSTFVLCCLFLLAVPTSAQDITSLEKIGDLASFKQTKNTVLLTCSDNSQVQLTILAPDLIRIRAAFTQSIPTKDHSWAIAKTKWDTPRWSVSEKPNAVAITTDELEVTIRRSPLLIEFRDAKSKAMINADERPMAYDARGSL